MNELKKKFMSLQGLEKAVYGLSLLSMAAVLIFFLMELSGFWGGARMIYIPSAAVMMLCQSYMDRKAKKRSFVFSLICTILLGLVSILMFIFQ